MDTVQYITQYNTDLQFCRLLLLCGLPLCERTCKNNCGLNVQTQIIQNEKREEKNSCLMLLGHLQEHWLIIHYRHYPIAFCILEYMNVNVNSYE